MATRKNKEETPLSTQDLAILSMLSSSLKPDTISETSVEDHRTHLIFDEIDEITAKEACEFLLKAFFDDPTKPVTLVVNSPGGSMDDGFAIVDLMEALPMTVRTVAMGQVMSMGFLIFLAGTKGERYMAPSTVFMSHQHSNVLAGKQFEIEATMRVQKISEETMLNHLQKHTGLTRKKIKDVLLPAQDVFLTAPECLKLGVGDKYMDRALFELIASEIRQEKEPE